MRDARPAQSDAGTGGHPGPNRGTGAFDRQGLSLETARLPRRIRAEP